MSNEINPTLDPKNKRLHEMRIQLGIKAIDLARTIRVAASNIYAIETGKKTYGDKLAEKMNLAYNANPEWLLHGKGEMFLAEGAKVNSLGMGNDFSIWKTEIETNYKMLIEELRKSVEEANIRAQEWKTLYFEEKEKKKGF